MAKKTLLLIEDEPSVSDCFIFLIKRLKEENEEFENIELQHADCLNDGIKLIETETIDTILLDLNLPDSRGIDTFDSIQAVAGDTPIIVMTGMDNEDLLKQVIAKGARNYLLKGHVNIHVVLKTVLAAITEQKI